MSIILLLGTAMWTVVNIAAEEGIVKPALRKALSPVTKFITENYDNKKADMEIQSAFKAVIEARWPKDCNKKMDDSDTFADYIKKLGLSTLLSDANEELRAQFSIELIHFTKGSSPSKTLRELLEWPDDQINELSSLLTDLRESISKIKDSEWGPMLSYANDMHTHEKLEKLDEVYVMIIKMYSEWNKRIDINSDDQNFINDNQATYNKDDAREHTESLLKNYRKSKMDLELKLSEIVDERNITLDDKRALEQLNKKITQLEKEFSDMNKL